MARYAKFAAAEVLKRILEDEDDDITDSDSSSQSLSEGEGDHLPEEELLSDSQDEIEVVKMNSRLELRGRPARGRFCRSSRGRGGRSISSSICDSGIQHLLRKVDVRGQLKVQHQDGEDHKTSSVILLVFFERLLLRS